MGPKARLDKVRRLPPGQEECFPNLAKGDYCVARDKTPIYNCIAFAAGVMDRWWWPPVDGEQVEGVDWPDGAPPAETVEAFVIAFGTRDYTACDGPDPEEGFEKIAIYVDAEGVPTHAARLIMPCGAWASKLGKAEEIRHKTLAALESAGAKPAYGKAVHFLKRPLRFSLTPPFNQVLDCIIPDGEVACP
jgi:hypothetical protein